MSPTALLVLIGLTLLLLLLRKNLMPRGYSPELAPLPSLTSEQRWALWKAGVLYVLVFILTTTATASAYYFFLQHVTWSRRTVFFVSWTLLLLVAFLGFAYEEKVLWKNYFAMPKGHEHSKWAPFGKRPTISLAPPPLTLGALVGVFFFSEYDHARP